MYEANISTAHTVYEASVNLAQSNKMGEKSVNVNISNSLQAYLSKSSNSTNSSNGDDKSGYFSWLHKKKPDEEIFDDSSNGWFNQAQKDPCLPSLVGFLFVLHLF